MAQIPVEKKSGIPSWVWILLALVVIGLIAWFLLGNDDDELETSLLEGPATTIAYASGMLTTADQPTL
jgi:hypothetical protein